MIVQTVAGTFEVEPETGEVEPTSLEVTAQPQLKLNLPRLVAAASVGPTVVAVVDAKPPLLLSYDGGVTWRQAGRGLPPGRAVTISELDPDSVAFAARNRVYVSRDGGVFWSVVPAELPEIVALEL
ncbi:MAG TPA: sialidase family protein [Gaiellaceae bacterium]